MKEYKFETDQFGLSSEGVHLLRSRYNYETITFSQITKIRFERSRIVNNWMILFLSGLSAVAFSVYYVLILFEVFNDDRVHSIYIEEVMVPFFLLIFGVFMIYSSIRTGTMMIVSYGKKTRRLSLEKLKKENKLDDFIREFNTSEYKQGKEIRFATYL